MGLQEYLYYHLPFLGDENFKHFVLIICANFWSQILLFCFIISAMIFSSNSAQLFLGLN